MTGTLVITGANGFVGPHLANAAYQAGHRVIGIGRETAPSRALSPYIHEYLPADLYSTWPVSEPVDAIVHLAGLAAVGPSFAEPQRYIDTNSGIMTRMCEALRTLDASPRVVVVSSGSVYAPAADGIALSEESVTAPTSPYTIAKVLVELQAEYYASLGLDTVVARPFNHIGPCQGSGFIVPDLAGSLRQLPDDVALQVGNLAAERDYTDVRDVVQAYLALAFAPTHRHAVYNVASGTCHSGYEILEAVAEALNRPLPEIRVDPARLRPNDQSQVRGDSSRLRDEFGWKPTIDYRASIKDFAANIGAPGAPGLD